MKKFLFIIALCAAGVITASAQLSSPTFYSASFLAGNQSIYLTNATTTLYGAANVGYTNAQGTAVFSNTNLYTTNGFGGKVATGGTFTNSNVFFGNAWNDVPSFSDRNGNNASASISVTITGGENNYSTNLVGFLFEALTVANSSPNGLFQGSLPVTAPSQGFSFVVSPATNGVAVTVSTNLPASFIQGAAGIRLVAVTNTTAAAAEFKYINSITLNGYRP